MPAQANPSALTQPALESLRAIETTPRDILVRRAMMHPDLPGWLSEAIMVNGMGAGIVTLLGRFDVNIVDLRQKSFLCPSVMMAVTRPPAIPGQDPRTAFVALYLEEEGKWSIGVRERGGAPWIQYAGGRELHRNPSNVNGDDPDEIEKALQVWETQAKIKQAGMATAAKSAVSTAAPQPPAA